MNQGSNPPVGQQNFNGPNDNGDKWFWLFVIVATICWTIQQILK